MTLESKKASPPLVKAATNLRDAATTVRAVAEADCCGMCGLQIVFAELSALAGEYGEVLRLHGMKPKDVSELSLANRELGKKRLHETVAQLSTPAGRVH